MARANANVALPWIVDKDTSLVVQVSPEGKKILSVADLVCNVCRASGITTISILEHNLVPKVDAS